MYNYRYDYWVRPQEKLTAHITMSELIYMREHERMTNREIALRCGVSTATIRKYIGVQPKNLKEGYGIGVVGS